MSNLSSNNKTKSSVPIEIITAASLFDGHDAAINIMIARCMMWSRRRFRKTRTGLRYLAEIADNK